MNGRGTRRDVEKERFWRQVIEEQDHSGQSVRGYCRQHGLSEPSFYAWRRELQRRDGKPPVRTTPRRPVRAASPRHRRPAFVSVRLDGGALPVGTASIECLFPSGASLRLPAETEPAAIAAVLRHWELWPC